jgi:pyruvate kinase
MNGLSLHELIDAVRELRAGALRQEAELSNELSALDATHAAAGRNLAHYLAVRQHDIRDLQRALAGLGLSSLGRLESCVVSTLNAVETALCALAGAERAEQPATPTDIGGGDAALADRATELLGPEPSSGRARVMVTLPMESDGSLVDELVASGTDVLRINCSKGSASAWERLIEHARAAERRHGRSCRVLCDLAGPNPRTARLYGSDHRRGFIARVSTGDRLLLAKERSLVPRDVEELPLVGCTLPSILDDIREGDRVFYDDGKIEGVVRAVSEGTAVVEVTATRKPRIKLRPAKGLNFPDSKLALPSLTDKDLEDLKFVVAHADMVGLSFVRSAEDVMHAQETLAGLGGDRLGVVLKIETLPAFSALPRLLLAALRSPRVGVMVARGDMALELGYARLAEAQEEILWICEAAMVPVIWATQVLESLNKTGVPSRGEVTDAAMGARAECVMLNQGEHVVEAVRFLAGVLDRMRDHQEKKRSLLRRLSISTISPAES